jgi:hypothetical protein
MFYIMTYSQCNALTEERCIIDSIRVQLRRNVHVSKDCFFSDSQFRNKRKVKSV